MGLYRPRRTKRRPMGQTCPAKASLRTPLQVVMLHGELCNHQVEQLEQFETVEAVHAA